MPKIMKISVFKPKGNKETVVREDIETIVRELAEGKYIGAVHQLREYYHLMNPKRTDDGRNL